MNQHFDLVIIGGGVAGLWLLDRARQAGYSAVLFERDALGAGQSVASQGMIHGGMKYALGGKLTNASETIADMPVHWQACLRGEGDVDLRGTQLLSDAYYMWPGRSIRSRLGAFLGSKAVRGKVTETPEHDRPAFFRGHAKGPLYRLHDIVLDVPSLLHTLAQRQQQCIYKLDPADCRVEADEQGVRALTLPDGSRISAERFVLTAGAGNENLLQTLQLPEALRPQMQRRPLRMVIVKHRIDDPVFVHCVSDALTATPELTITTHPCRDGRTAWYLGGALAEAGAQRDDATQLQVARDLLDELFPWCDFSESEFLSFPIDRAEARQPGGTRPDGDTLMRAGRLLCAWPTKLTLTPILANRVLETLTADGVAPSHADVAALPLPHPAVAVPPWDVLP